MRLRFGAVLAVTAAAAIALGGCSSSSDTSSGVDAATLVKQSSDAMKGLSSAHIVITAEGKVPNLKGTKLEADVASKPAVAATGSASIAMGQQTQDAKLIFVEGHLYSDIAEPGKSCGAIAYATNGAGASVWNYPSRSDAESTALDYCGCASCKVLSSFKHCGAVVFDGSSLQGGYGPTLSAAIADAKGRLPNSYVDSWACT